MFSAKRGQRSKRNTCIIFAHRFLYWLYERLTLHTPPEPADLIFVLAGKMERKAYGLGLYRSSIAGRLLLSVGRFEVSKLHPLGLAFTEELIQKRNDTPSDQRHFFCEMDLRRTRIVVPNLARWNTYGEALGLRDYLAANPAKKIIIVSTDIHLRRVALTLEQVFGRSPIEFRYCPVPESLSSVAKHRWWTRGDDRRYVLAETVKLIGYRAIFLLPDSAVRRCMRLKD